MGGVDEAIRGWHWLRGGGEVGAVPEQPRDTQGMAWVLGMTSCAAPGESWGAAGGQPCVLASGGATGGKWHESGLGHLRRASCGA